MGSERLEEIRARLEALEEETAEDAADLEYDPQVFVDEGWGPALAAALADAVPDLAYLLHRVDALEAEVAARAADVAMWKGLHDDLAARVTP
jgi:BMFP domain-containing protein YqiC